MKTASGLGKLLAGLIVDATDLPTAENIELITAAQLDSLGWWSAITLLVLGVLGVISFAGYRPLKPADPGKDGTPLAVKPEAAG